MARNPQYILKTACTISQRQLNVFPMVPFSKWRIPLLEILIADVLGFPPTIDYVDGGEVQNLVHRLPSHELLLPDMMESMMHLPENMNLNLSPVTG